MQKMPFAAAMKDYFSARKKDDGSNDLIGFMNELKALTDADKAWFRDNLSSVGYEITL